MSCRELVVIMPLEAPRRWKAGVEKTNSVRWGTPRATHSRNKVWELKQNSLLNKVNLNHSPKLPMKPLSYTRGTIPLWIGWVHGKAAGILMD